MAYLGGREELLAAAWLMSLRSARTRRAYAGDLRAWVAWLAEREIDVLAAGRVHTDLWVAGQLERGAEAPSVRRRLSALSSFYRYCATHDMVSRIPHRRRGSAGGGPGLHRHHRPDSRRGARLGRGPPPAAAVIRLLLHNALRLDEACAADVPDLGTDAGHRVLRVTRKGARKAKVPADPRDSSCARRLPR